MVTIAVEGIYRDPLLQIGKCGVWFFGEQGEAAVVGFVGLFEMVVARTSCSEAQEEHDKGDHQFL